METAENPNHRGVTIDKHTIRVPPGPEGLPFVGSFYEVFPDHLGNHQRMFETYGPVIKTTDMGRTTYLTNDPAIAAIAFEESPFFTKKINKDHPLYGIKHNEAGLFIADSDAPEWKITHKFITPAFTPKAIRHYTPLFYDTIREAFTVFDEFDERGEAFNVYPYMLKLGSQAIGKFALNLNLHHFDGTDAAIHPLVKTVADGLVLNKKVVSRGDWYSHLPFGDPAKLRETQKRLAELIMASASEVKASSTGDLPLQDAALQASCIVDYVQRAVDTQGNKVPKENVVPILAVVIGAGFATTSSLLSWLLYCCVTYPEMQERLLQEYIDHGIDENTEWGIDEVAELHFQENFVKEVQRLHNPSYQPGRTARVDCILPGGYKIPAEAVMIIALHHIHNNPEIWNNPHKFDPDRWDRDETKQRHKCAYIPFAHGGRMCIGFNFALTEVKTFLPKLIYRYKWEKASEDPVEYDPMFQLIRPMNLYVRAKRRTEWPEKSKAAEWSAQSLSSTPAQGGPARMALEHVTVNRPLTGFAVFCRDQQGPPSAVARPRRQRHRVPSYEGRPVVVLGGGVLGRRIACVWAAGGYDVRVRDPSAEQRTGAVHYFETSIAKFLKSEDAKYGAVKAFEDLETAVENAWLIIECVPEKLPLKISTFADLEKVAPKDAILCTNSSSYKSREMLEKVGPATAERICNMHYMMPPENRIVELMTDGQTEPEIFQFLSNRLTEVGMHPVVARKESTGFVINRLWAAIKRETLTILSEGVSVPPELDSVWIEMFSNGRAGPCAMMDAVGLDTVSFIEQHYMTERGLSGEKTVDFLKKYLDEGRLGAKSSKGGLYPPGYTTKAAGEPKSHHDDLHAPVLYFLDIGLANVPQEVFSKGRILVGAPDGRKPQTLVENEHFPDGIAISLPAGKLLWTSMGIPSKNDGSIRSCNLDGSDVKEIVPKGATHTPKQTYLDQVNQKLYFSDREGLRVMRCDLDGSNLETIICTGDWQDEKDATDQTKWCVGIAVSPESGKFYWTQKGPSKGSQGRIFRAGIDIPSGQDASTRTDIECLFQGLPEPIDLEIDEHTNTLFWTDRGELPLGNSLNKVAISKLKPVEGKTVSMPSKDYDIIARNLHEAIGLKLDEKNQHIYLTDLGGTVYRFDMDGSNRKKIYDGEGAYAGITLAYV
ncbi:cytochrome P450 [Rhizodiscina lignyota]|uniref:Cytochrome P450 n=1 Tax=Rhizodiscina lignyota TaxID=1504668 RepID=A0A9P4I028_9PEZI|nr:cytochrome P450 [Rhizodiscina lignyota]